MNVEFLSEILSRVHHPLNAPGSLNKFLEHPSEHLRHRLAVPLGVVMEHRFAFCHWTELKHKTLLKSGRSDDANFVAPDLVTFDWHDDFGVPDDYDESQLLRLNQADENEVAMFAWAGLCALNDGHIRPAVWLNTVGNVYIVLKQGWDTQVSRDEIVIDRFGNEHRVFYCRTPRAMIEPFQNTYTGSGVIWDLDLDYLTRWQESKDRWFAPLISNRQIRAALAPKSEWMQMILPELRAITIALEPEYTGGIAKSMHLFKQWERNFFKASVFDDECPWRDDLFG